MQWRWWLSGLAVGTALLLAAGVASYRYEVALLRADRISDLKAIASLKAGQISQWRQGRLTDAVRNTREAWFPQVVASWMRRGGDGPETAELRRGLDVERTQGHYREALLIDAEGRVLLSTAQAPEPVGAATRRALEHALAQPEGALSDLYRSAAGPIVIDAVAAFPAEQGQPRVAIVFRTETAALLDPLVESWPTPSPSAETLLVQRDGDDALFLTELRHQRNTALTLRIPLSRTDAPATRAVAGAVGEWEGRDYRGTEVVAWLTAIDGAPWSMVAKVDAAEIFAEADFRAGAIGAIVALLVLLGCAATAFALRQAGLFQSLYEAERVARQVQEEFRTTLYSIGDGVIVTDSGARLTQMNAVAERLTGWSEAEARGKPISEVFRIVNEDTGATVESPLARVFRDGAVVGLANHTLLLARDGSQRPIADSGAPIRRLGGPVTGAVLVFQDQSTTRAADARERHLNRVLRAIRNVNQLIVREHEPQRLIDAACRSLTETRGYSSCLISAAELHGESGWTEGGAAFRRQVAEGFVPPCWREARAAPGGVAVTTPARHCAQCAAIPACSRSAGTAVLRHAGQELGMLQVGFPQAIAPDQDEAALLGEVACDLAFALHDIDATQRGERYARIVAAAREAMALLGPGYRFLAANPSYAQLYGRADRGLTGASLASVLGEAEFAVLKPHLDRCFAGEEVRLESTCETAAGRRTLEAIYSPCRDAAGPVTAVAVCLRDVTQTRELQAQLAQADRLASMGMVAASVAHEINNPLVFVLSNLESLAEDLPAFSGKVPVDALAEVVARVHETQDGATRIRAIARGLGTFSRVESTEVGAVHLQSAVEHAITMASNELRYRARLTRDFGPVPPVRGSDGKLAQVFLNLLVNAAHAIGEGRPEHNEVRVRTWAEGDTVLAEVADTGKGIAPEHRPRIFEPFFTTKGVGVGSGLGLSVCRNIITGFGGSISFESEVGRGTRFLVRLPAEVVQPAQGEPRQAAAAVARGRVLVVDDEAGIRKAITRMLGASYDVVGAGTGAEGRALLERDQAFDVLLFDLMMPELSGMELHEWVARTSPALARRVIFITGGAFTQRARDYLASVPNRRLEKPFEASELRGAVDGLRAVK